MLLILPLSDIMKLCQCFLTCVTVMTAAVVSCGLCCCSESPQVTVKEPKSHKQDSSAAECLCSFDADGVEPAVLESGLKENNSLFQLGSCFLPQFSGCVSSDNIVLTKAADERLDHSRTSQTLSGSTVRLVVSKRTGFPKTFWSENMTYSTNRPFITVYRAARLWPTVFPLVVCADFILFNYGLFILGALTFSLISKGSGEDNLDELSSCWRVCSKLTHHCFRGTLSHSTLQNNNCGGKCPHSISF